MLPRPRTGTLRAGYQRLLHEQARIGHGDELLSSVTYVPPWRDAPAALLAFDEK